MDGEQLGDHVGVNTGARHAVSRAGNRPADVVTNTEVAQCVEHRGDSREEIWPGHGLRAARLARTSSESRGP